MKYSELIEKTTKRVNDLPMIFAFSSEQLDNALDDMGLSMKDMKGDKLIRMGFGAFCLKSDLDYVLSELDAVEDMKREFIKDYEHAYDAFFYEMGNHEYHINYEGDWDVLSCFGLNDDVCEYEDGKDVDEYMDAMGLSPVTKAAYHDARGWERNRIEMLDAIDQWLDRLYEEHETAYAIPVNTVLFTLIAIGSSF